MRKAIIGWDDLSEDYGPCSCGSRATVPVAIPASWVEEEAEQITALLREHRFRFAQGYDYRRVFGPVRDGDYLLNYSACEECCTRAEELGIAERGELRFSSNAIVEGLLGA